MAADAIVHNHFRAGGNGFNHLRFHPQGEHTGMAQAIFRLEKPFVEKVIVRNVAVVARGVNGMRTVIPSGVVGGHDVAIYACFRLVRKVAGGFGYVNKIYHQSANDARHDNANNFCTC